MAQVREKSLSPQPIRRVDAPSAQPNAPQAAGSTCLPRLTLCTLCGRCKSIGIPKRKFPLPRMVPALYPQGIRDVNGYFSPQATHHRADHAGAIPQSECVRVTCNQLVGLSSVLGRCNTDFYIIHVIRHATEMALHNPRGTRPTAVLPPSAATPPWSGQVFSRSPCSNYPLFRRFKGLTSAIGFSTQLHSGLWAQGGAWGAQSARPTKRRAPLERALVLMVVLMVLPRAPSPAEVSQFHRLRLCHACHRWEVPSLR